VLRQAYERSLREHGYQADPAQLAAVDQLEDLRRRLARADRRSGGWLDRLGRALGRSETPPAERGVYLWGGVGRGKTFLVDLFHSHAEVPSRRDHFHRFMKEVHGQLGQLRDVEQPLDRVADALASSARVVCLDELFVSDIADAMILSGLFSALTSRGVSLVFTSNAPPSELYREGLQRQRFLPAIAHIEAHTTVVNVDSGTDYRLRQLERAPLYISTKAYDADARLQQRFEAIAGHPGEAGGSIVVVDRPIPVRRRTEDVIWFDFDAICNGPRSQADYVEIARDFHTVVVSGVPRFDVTLENQARRFIALVDEFYDRNVKLVLSAEAPPNDLYAGERLAFEFARTTSRLTEMQSHEFLARPHRP
jgi:cell division protein ZapE